MTEIILNGISIIGVVAFSVSGALVAIDHRVDLFGVILLASMTSFGGGIARDVLLGQNPPLLFCDPFYFVMAGVSVFTAVAVFVIARIMQDRFVRREALIDRIDNIFDALALGVFATSGAKMALDTVPDANGFLVISMAAVTAIGGGMLRDILIREVPFVLRKRIYAVAAICGGALYYILVYVRVPETVAVIAGSMTTFALRMLATVFHWNFPKAIK